MTAAPRSAVDLFDDAALLDPYPRLRELRDLGPVVWLEAHDVLAVSRFDEARAVLDDDVTFLSGAGVGLNDFINTVGRGTTLMSDGAEHRTQRDLIGRPLTPRALAALRPPAQALADGLIDRLLAAGGACDGVADLAEVLPTTWVPDLLGWPVDRRDRLVAWGGASFDGLGPMNERAEQAGAGIVEMSTFAQELASAGAGALPAGSFAGRIVEAAAQGEVAPGRCPMMIVDYLAPSLDTTISALGNALWLFATHPDQWQLLRDDPTRVKAAFNEVLRLESPISCFTRLAAADAVVGGVDVPAGSRVLVSFASANRDERRWEDPERFDITRESAGQLAFGHGEHTCVGMGLARLEGAAVLGAMAERVAAIELAAEPVRKLNNLIRAFSSLPIRLLAS
jgi:cytochrome P450